MTVHRLECKACLSIFFSWLGSWLMQGTDARQQRAWRNRHKPTKIIRIDRMFAYLTDFFATGNQIVYIP
jgi:hypothetical protein